MNTLLDALEPYPFTKLSSLLSQVTPAQKSQIRLSVGEPQHAPPQFVLDTLAQHLPRLANYPATAGIPELRASIGQWVTRRFGLADFAPDEQVIPVNGTREALFAFAQAVVNHDRAALVVSPNPFYQIYEGATLLAGAQPLLLPCDAQNQFLPDFDSVTSDQWQRTQLLYLCTPGNPTGAVASIAQLQKLVALAREHDFVIASDECYSEIYLDESTPPPGLLQACAAMGEHTFHNCVVFHSLSKRSNLPGLRSGFVAGDAAILRRFMLYRTYHGCAMPLHHQYASIAAWSDEAHVAQNRAAYRAKFSAVLDILGASMQVTAPDAGFYLWPQTPGSDEAFAQQLYADENVVVLPGSYLGRTVDGRNPGNGHVRMALVAGQQDCVEAAQRIAHHLARG